MGYDAIALKSGWDEYGIAYGKPTTKVHIREVLRTSSSGSGISFGSEMSGGILNILVEHLHILPTMLYNLLRNTQDWQNQILFSVQSRFLHSCVRRVLVEYKESDVCVSFVLC